MVDQHSLDIAARITPLEVDTKVANALLGAVTVTAAALASEQPRRLHLEAAGLQGRRQRPDCLRPAVGRGHFLKDSDSPLGRCHHSSPKAGASALASLLSAVGGLDTPLEVDTKIANALLGSPPRPSSQRSF